MMMLGGYRRDSKEFDIDLGLLETKAHFRINNAGKASMI